jgi:cation:H+ antiporter
VLSDALLIAGFLVAAALSLGTSWILVSRLERIGARLGLSEALLGLVAALAADTPEITAAVTAMAGHRASVGAGVVVGSNVFNLAALLGLGAIVAGRIVLHRRVILLEGVVALVLAAVTVMVVVGAIPPAGGLAVVGVVLLLYGCTLGLRPSGLKRLGVPAGWAAWLSQAVHEEELELEPAIHPPRGGRTDVVVALAAVAVVVGASVAMTEAATKLGTRHGISQVVVGALILAAVTSVPNAVAAIYLAMNGRGTATLSTAMNSNALNVLGGLMIPATAVGLAASSTAGTLAAAWYLGLTAFALLCAYAARGLTRLHGALIAGAYAVFVAAIIVSA